ncbi:hypothetical protein [Marivita sp. GX14005]|uniref:hypothetical protein n=1 Tax=Marivita sp. GX14005 TaxID=2942276 RepID=UPI002018FABF|nr:hypothetical protein [Marivita sp. GX14005]MCL3883315.1 hypothetical protein [Marivita sp. GX14005]
MALPPTLPPPVSTSGAGYYEATLGDGRAQVPGVVNPQTLLRGTGDPAVIDPKRAADAEALFPTFDADGELIGSRPPGYGATPDKAAFLLWHSAHRMAWLNEHGSATTANDGVGDVTFRHGTIGTAPDALSNLHVLLTQDSKRIVVLNHLQPADIAKLPLDDQRALVLHPAYSEVVAARFDLRPAGGETVAEARKAAQDLVQAARTNVTDGLGGDAAAQLTEFLNDPGKRAQLWQQAFVAQYDLMLDALNSMAVFDLDRISQDLGALSERFIRLERFFNLPAEGTRGTMPTDVNAVNGPSGIIAGRDTLVRIELQLYDLARLSREVAQTQVFEGKRLDTPGLTFVLQTFANYRNEAQAEAKTEELNQRNLLLQDYTRMQKIVNAALAKFDASKLSDPNAREQKTVDLSSPETRRTVAMFDKGLSGSAVHPMEAAVGLDRPVSRLVTDPGNTGVAHYKEEFDRFAIALSEGARQLGQDNQILMGEIAQLNRIKNRHYDIATNVLNKMTTILRSIIN